MIAGNSKNLIDRNRPLKPFLRWAGGKQWLSKRLLQMVPQQIGKYYEPFLGGGSLFFRLLPEKGVLSDVNERLVETYRSLRDEPHKVIAALGRWTNDEATYYRVRDRRYLSNAFKSAQLIYLNRTCWNGLYRVNLSGEFNVPYGHHERKVFDPEHLLRISRALNSAELRVGDFLSAVNNAQENDFIYFDPPYTTQHSQNGFLKYNQQPFTWEDQERLGRTAVELMGRGCHVVVSNASYEPILNFYPGFHHESVSRNSVLAANPENRQITTEFLIYSPEIARTDSI